MDLLTSTQKFSLMQMGVLAPHLCMFDGITCPPLTWVENCKHMCPQSHIQTSPPTPKWRKIHYFVKKYCLCSIQNSISSALCNPDPYFLNLACNFFTGTLFPFFPKTKIDIVSSSFKGGVEIMRVCNLI